MAVRFSRCLGPVTALDPGQFTLETASGRPAVCCPVCSQIFEVHEAHEAHHWDRDGRVFPALRCGPGCSFFDFVELSAISEEVLA